MRLKKLRLKQGMAQADLAKRLGVYQPLISAWETGRYRPSPHNIPRLTEALNCTYEELFGDEEEQHGAIK